MDYNSLGAKAEAYDTIHRPIDPMLHLQIDADVLSYDCANLEEPYSMNCRNLNTIIEQIRKGAGAAHANLHLTLGLKGGRHEMATVKPYQVGRKRDPELTVRVKELRNYMANYTTATVTPVVNLLQEADDSLAQWQLARIMQHGCITSAIYSIDKDLWMVEGVHVEPYTFEKYRVEGYGHTEYKDVGNVKPKLVGRGTSWFWHQMIMGDKVDDIPGLPMLSAKHANQYFPLKKYNANRKPLKCGEAKAVGILLDVTDDSEAFERVIECYYEWYGSDGMEMFVEQAYLLWIRPSVNPWHVLEYFKSLGRNIQPTMAQTNRLLKFKADAQKILRGNK